MRPYRQLHMLLLVTLFTMGGCSPENPVEVRNPTAVNIITGDSINVQFSIPATTLVTIVVQNAVGDDIRIVMEDQPMVAGYHLVKVDLSGLERGGRLYFVTLRYSGQVRSSMFKLQ